MSDDPAEVTAERMAEGFEGFRSQPYQDPAGVWTIGYGSTRDANGAPVTAATPGVTRGEARQLLLRDMRRAMQAVQGDVRVPLSTDEEAALIDFTYNLGSGALQASTLLRLLNAGDYAGAAAQFDRWDHAGGKVLAGLLRRREAEKALFQTAAVPAPAAVAGAAPDAVATAPPAELVAAAAPAPTGMLAAVGRFFSGLFG